MAHKKVSIVCNIVFGFLTAGLFYFMPYIAWYTMEGDKTDIIMGMVFGVIPTGLLLLSFLYGFLAKRVIMPVCMASALSIPVIFIPIVAGNTVFERGFALIYCILMIFIIVCLGTGFGISIRWLLSRIKRKITKKLLPP